MENKYYTPEIEEFHVGFEFESNYISYSRDNEWVKVTLGKDDINYEGVSWFYSSYIGDAVPTEFRVKRLDREDIESLGFKLNARETHYAKWEGKDDAQLYYQECNHFTQIYNYTGSISFEGIIKNKSELKRILKQIGV